MFSHTHSSTFPKTCTGWACYGFNGKEKDDEWNGTDGADLDFDARIYDARIGKFLSIDPLFSKYPGFSPFHFGLNNPIIYVDSKGKDSWVAIEGTSANEPGHTMMAVSNWKEVKVTINGKMETRYVQDGYKLMQNSPWYNTDLTTNKKSPISILPITSTKGLLDFAEPSVNGIVQLTSTTGKGTEMTIDGVKQEVFTADQVKNEVDMLTIAKNKQSKLENKKFDMVGYSCSDFISDVIQPVVNDKDVGNTTVPNGDKTITRKTPNKLFQDLIKKGYKPLVGKDSPKTTEKGGEDYLKNYKK
jgi:RHS repeat-associated protein